MKAFFLSKENLVKLTRALSGRAAPLFQVFSCPQTELDDECRSALADMLEARKRHPACLPLKRVDLHKRWFLRGLLAPRIRLLRLLLPSLELINSLTWDAAFEPILLQTRPACLESLTLAIHNGDAVPSAEVLGAVPALKQLNYFCSSDFLGHAAVPPLITALHRGVGLKHLERVYLDNCRMGVNILADLLDAFDRSGCAKHLKSIAFVRCTLGVEGVRALADFIRRDSFLVLEILRLANDEGIGNECIAAVANALGEAPRTSLTALLLVAVGMCDVGMAALASLIQKGRLKQLKVLDLCGSCSVSDDGIIALAQAIDERGLPALQSVMVELDQKVSVLGCSAITHALIKGSPGFIKLRLPRTGEDAAFIRTMINGMLRAARRKASIDV